MDNNTKFTFTFYRFTGQKGNRSTELTRDYNQADGMRSLIEAKPEQVQLAQQRVNAWVDSKGITVIAQEPYPSTKYPGKVWLEYRFGGLA